MRLFFTNYQNFFKLPTVVSNIQSPDDLRDAHLIQDSKLLEGGAIRKVSHLHQDPLANGFRRETIFSEPRFEARSANLQSRTVQLELKQPSIG